MRRTSDNPGFSEVVKDGFTSAVSDLLFTKSEKIIGKNLPKKIAVAVSGGADSLALTLLLQRFCLEKEIKLFALTVDHKVRASSSGEAKKLGSILAGKNISHKILSLNSDKIPQKNIEAGLRELRYELLCSFCKKNKIEFLFLGHHLGDVAENFLIRLFRGSGLDGLSTMAEVCERNGIVLVRPLLDITKDELKAFLQGAKVQWFEDETNGDEKFLRNKIRKFFDGFSEKNLIQKRIKRAADEIAEIRDSFDGAMLDEAKKILQLRQNSFVIDCVKLDEIDKKIALKILALVAMEVSGKGYKPRMQKLNLFYEYLIAGDKIKSRNFYGCTAKNLGDGCVEFLSVKAPADKKLVLRTILKNGF